MRRGFTSLHGAFLAISWDTGKVIDYEVLSRHCQQCTIFQRKLSKHEISKEQYTANVRGHGNDLQGMACAIWASVVHCVSTDDKPQHQFCPPGPDSWCKWQSHQAGGPEYQHKKSLPDAVFKVIKPVYLRLTERQLLEKCLRGATQNRNECINGLIWQICPKTVFCSSRTVQTAVAIVTACFNEKNKALEEILEAMGLTAGHYTRTALEKLDR